MNNVIEMPNAKMKMQIPSKRTLDLSEVEVIRRSDTQFPMIMHKRTGILHQHANEFLLVRYNHCSFIDEVLKQSTPITIKNYADHLRYWLNICSLLKKPYVIADYSFLENVLVLMRKEGTEEASIANYLSTWRLFYQYLDKIKVNHAMLLPAKVSAKRILSDAEQRGDFLNYTKLSNLVETKQDPLIDSSRIKNKNSYISSVLSITQVKALISELRSIDLVYGVMAKVQLDTCLRIEELITYFPHTSNHLNPDFMSWGEMYSAGTNLQPLNFIGKGRKNRKINVDIKTMQLIQDEFLSAKERSSDTLIYNKRKLQYQTDYLSTKLGKRSKFSIDSDILWLTSDGHPVSKYMYQEAFRIARKRLYETSIIPRHIIVSPHSMRHTGASLRLVKYRQKTGVEIHIDNDGDIHAFLKDLLGHDKMETTHMYIRTVRSRTFNNLALKTIIRNEELWEKEITASPALKKGVDAIKGQ